MRTKVIHLIPFDGIGGVETAARSMDSGAYGPIDFQVFYVYKRKEDAGLLRLCRNLRQALSVVQRLLTVEPDIVVVSLWRSSLVGIAYKLLRPKVKLVTFLHSACDVHFADYLATRASVRLSSMVWADSTATSQARLGRGLRRQCRIISCVTERFDVGAQKLKPGPRFIYWGRVNRQKGLGRAVRFFSAVAKSYPDAWFLIIGPDEGGAREVAECCEEYKLGDRVALRGAATQEEIIRYAKTASFYLQTSTFEGMAMSVVEAMQLGLVPVVAPVGEIRNYCQDGVNSILVHPGTESHAVSAVMKLLDSADEYFRLRANAIETWVGHPLYRESVIEACTELLA